MKIIVKGFLCLFAGLVICRPMAGAQCTGADNVTSTGVNAGAGSTWTNPNSVQSTDGSVASVSAIVSALSIITTTTDYLNVTNLGLSVPSSNTICGVEVTVNRQTFAVLGLGTSTVSDNSIRLIKGGVMTGTEHAATGVAWPTSMGTATYGSSSDLWGVSLAPSDVNASNFGVAISTKLVAEVLSVAFSARIDQVTVTVYSQAIVLPVGLQEFTARRSVRGNELDWTVSGGAAIDRVVVQRSADGVGGWGQLDVMDAGGAGGGAVDGSGGSAVDGAGGTAVGGSGAVQGSASDGSSSDAKVRSGGSGADIQQSYIDANPLPGTNFYRLHLLSASGASFYSEVKAISGRSTKNISTCAYPNPFTDVINVTSGGSFTRLALLNLRGETVWQREYGAGVSKAYIPAAGLSGGMYFIQVDGAVYQLIKN